MKPQYKSPQIKFPQIPRCTPFKDFTNLFDVNISGSKHDIVLNIRFDANQLSDLFSSISRISFSEDSALADQNNEKLTKELTADKEDPTPELWIDDKNYLTCREVEIMERLSKGWLNKEIAADLELNVYTVRNHLHNIYPKFGVGNRSEAIIEYLKCRDKNK
jgi:DNA-binding NarL/FixJ family response regulator